MRDQLLDQTAGVAQQKLSLERFRTVWLPVPPQQEQKLLISKLDTIHELLAQGMARHRQLYAELTALEQSILAKAFRGELVPQDPNDEPAATLLARTTDTQAPAAQRKRGRPSRNTPKAHG